MRLIDEDLITRSKELTKKIVIHNLTPYIKVDDLIDFIDSLPTAYDVEKVVEQLEEERELSYADFDRYVEEVSTCLDAEYDDYFHRGLERAIKIVKGGGVNE